MTLTWLDYAFLLVLTISMLAGFMRGLIREALGLGAWIVALLAARVFAKPLGEMLEPYISHPDARLVLGFVLVIFVVVMVCGFVIRLLNAAVEWVGMGFFNRVAGACFGLARGAAILVIATVVIGGTLLSGGAGYVFGTLFGVLTMGLIQTYIVFDGTLSSWWTKIAIGVLLLAFIVLQKALLRLGTPRASALG